jgi:hypothetical protein
MSTPAGRVRTERLRAIPLTDILRASDGKPDPRDPAKWHTARGTFSVNGAKFFDWNQATGGGGAIDLAMHLNGLDFKQALDWLASRFTPGDPPAAVLRSPPALRLVLPGAVADALPAIIRYLSDQRRLPLARLQPLVDGGDLYADRHRNAVFLLRNERHAPVGAELRGTGGETWRGLAPGSRKDNGCFAVGPTDPHALVLCESAIDAISCHTLDPDRLCLSTAGARDNPAWLPAILARNLPTYCGFDTDATGERMARAMLARHPAVQRLRPPAHDWNDALRAQT